MEDNDNLPDLDALERLAKAATPGPWVYDGIAFVGKENVPGKGFQMIADNDRETGCLRPRGFGAGLPLDANGKFIAAANPQTVLALVAEVRRLREAEVVESCRFCACSDCGGSDQDNEHLNGCPAVRSEDE